jgi:biopolymer transport protein ExbD
MRLPVPAKRALPDSLLPMIDVVLFLIVFFMIASEFAATEPFAVAVPEAAADPALGEFTLFLSAAGEWGFVGPEGVVVTGEGALAALEAARGALCAVQDCVAEPPVLLVNADLAAPAAVLAKMLPQVRGFGEVRLLTVGG